MNRRDFVLRTLGGLALAAIPAPLLARTAPKPVRHPIPSPVGEKVDYRVTEDVFLVQLHQDFPQYAFWMTPLIYNPVSFIADRGILCAGPVTGGKTSKLRTRLSVGPWPGEPVVYNGLNIHDELYRAARQEIAYEFEGRKWEREFARDRYVHPQFRAQVFDHIDQRIFSFPYFT